MNKILIVDDEILTIEYLKSLPCWEKYDCGDILSAVTVSKALDIFRRERPQIVFIDVRMPKMDGLELSRIFLEIQPDTSIVIMTAYQEFAYVKEAMQIGVKNFLVKHEINEEKLDDILMKLLSNISYKQNYENVMWNDWLREIWEQGYSDKSEINACFGETKNYVFIMMNFYGLQTLLGEGEIERLSEKRLRKLCLPGMVIRAFSKLGTYTYGIFCEFNRVVSLAEQHRELLDSVGVLRDLLRAETESEILFLIAGSIKRSEYLRQVIQILKPLSTSVLLRWTNVIRIEELPAYEMLDSEKLYPHKIFQKWNVNDLEDMVKRVQDKKGFLDNKDKMLLCLYIKNKNIAENLKRKNEKQRINSVLQLLKMCIQCLKELEGREQGNRIVENAVCFIYEHYAEDISSQVIADKLNVSDGYLRMIFKKEQKCTLKEYITQYRLEKAKKMLIESNKKVYEIAAACGFSSSQHFCRVFHQRMGVAPGEYKQK